MKRETRLNLVPFRCPSCGRLVVWTLSGAKAFCPRCRVWFTEDRGGPASYARGAHEAPGASRAERDGRISRLGAGGPL